MIKKIELLLVMASILGFHACDNISQVNSTSKKSNNNIVEEIIKDINYTNGIGLQGFYSDNPKITRVLYPFGESKKTKESVWNLAQWGSKFDLKYSKPENRSEGVTYSNPGKSISFKNIDGSTQITMKMFGSREYLKPRQFGEDWPHILLEQKFKNPQPVSEIKNLNFNIDFRLLFSENKMTPETYNPQVHTTQFTIYLTFHNKNKRSKGYNDFIWFGLPLYDYRYDTIKEYSAADIGKEDASNKFIFSTASNNLFNEIPKGGNWIHVSKDIIDIVKNAFKIAKQRGFLIDTNLEDLYITSTNMGWETPGTFDCAIQYKNLKLTATKK